MSVHVLSWVLLHSPETLGRRLVLLSLANHAGEDGKASWPSVETIGLEARLSRSQVQRCLRGLEESGAIVRTGRSVSGTNVYRVVMKGGRKLRPSGSDGGPQIAAEGAANPPLGGAAPMRPEPSYKQPSLGPTARDLIAGYVDRCRELGADVPARARGQVARQVGELLDEGQEPELVARALELLVERRLNPSVLPTLILEAAAGPPVRARPLTELERDVRELMDGGDAA